MNIGMVGSLDFGTHTGARTRATRIYSLLSEYHDVSFLNVNTVNQNPLPEDISGCDLAYRHEWFPHTVRELLSGLRAVSIADEYDFDLVWAYNSFQHTPLIAYGMSRRLGIPLVVGVNDHRHGHGLKGRLVNEKARSFVLNRATVLAFESATLQRNIEEYGISPRRSVVIPTGIDVEKYYLPNEPLAEDPVVFYVGRDEDIDLLLDAAEILNRRLPDVTVRLAGVDGEAYPDYADRNYIQFLGYVTESDLCRELARAHVCTVPYRDADTAGRPVKILEYMSAAKCIVATDLPFNTQMLTDGENAILVETTPDAFADGLLLALEDSGERDRLATNAREDVQEYSLKQMSETLRTVVKLATEE